MSVTVLNPDADTESTSVDGIAFFDGADTWANAVAAAGNGANDIATSGTFLGISSTGNSNEWKNIFRAILLFDGSGITLGDIASAATLTIRGTSKTDTFSPTIGGNFNLYESAPASNVAIVAGDYNSLLAVSLGEDDITHAGWNASGDNVWTLNAAGLAVINTALLGDGIIKLGARENSYDVADSSPTWSSSKDMNIQGNWAGSANEPALSITHAPTTARANALFI